MSKKLHRADYSNGSVTWLFWCDACEFPHQFIMDGRWQKSGSEEAPTFNPSLLLRWKQTLPGCAESEQVCHLYLRNGKIEYLSDCTHKLAGHVVPLPDWKWSDD